jgi:DMSO reductase family type II enzyme chaperone
MTAARSDAPGGPEDVDQSAAATAALYTLLARAFDNPDDRFHEAAEGGDLQAEAVRYIDRSGLSVATPALRVEEDQQALSARFNGLFTLGHAEYTDRTDGSLDADGPPVPLYECRYREATWEDVNRDLARAYDYYGLEIDDDRRDHHDHLRLELEFAAYLARREAVGDEDAARARRDFLERHLDPFTEGLLDRLTEVERGFYTAVATLARRVVTADRDALAEVPDESD